MFRIVVLIGSGEYPGVWYNSKNWTIEEVLQLQKEDLRGFNYYLEYKNNIIS